MRHSLWIFLLLASVSYSQTKDDASASIEGTVTNSVTSQPVKSAQVHLVPVSGCGPMQQVVTDATGRFQFGGISAGTCRVLADARGYLRKSERINNQAPAGQVIAVKAAQHVSDVNILLDPMSVIRGRVLNVDGDPMVGCPVQAMRVTRRHNAPRGMSQGQTDDRGEYRVFDLVPGDYYVVANCNAGSTGMGMVFSRGQREQVTDDLSYVPTYYPGVAELKQASVVTVKPGDEATVDISVSKQKTVHVRGTVSGELPEGMGVMAMLMPRDLSIFEGPRGAPVIGGNFDISGILPGSYLLIVTAQGPNTPRKVAKEDVDVGPDGVEGLSLALASTANLKGAIRVDGTVPAGTNLSGLVVMLQTPQVGGRPASAFGMEAGFGQVDENGNFEIHDVAPGNYVVGLTANGENFRDWYTKTVQFAGHDVTDAGLRVGAGTRGATLDIVVSTHGASVEGTVVDSNNQPLGNISVMAIPDESRRKRFDLYDVSPSDERGHFELRGLASGEYSVIAAEGIELDDRFDLDAVAKYAREGTAVHLDDAAKKTIQLTLSPSLGAESQ